MFKDYLKFYFMLNPINLMEKLKSLAGLHKCANVDFVSARLLKYTRNYPALCAGYVSPQDCMWDNMKITLKNLDPYSYYKVPSFISLLL